MHVWSRGRAQNRDADVKTRKPDLTPRYYVYRATKKLIQDQNLGSGSTCIPYFVPYSAVYYQARGERMEDTPKSECPCDLRTNILLWSSRCHALWRIRSMPHASAEVFLYIQVQSQVILVADYTEIFVL